jgi:hypothetical protein
VAQRINLASSGACFMDLKQDHSLFKKISLFENAIKQLDNAGNIALKLGMPPSDVKKMKEVEKAELQRIFMNGFDYSDCQNNVPNDVL